MIERTKEEYLVDAPAPLYEESRPFWVCRCDLCRTAATGPAVDPGKAADLARSVGYVTRPGPTVEDPRIWACPECQAKPKEVWYVPESSTTPDSDD
jgi:ribosomal protein L37AE/L43A